MFLCSRGKRYKSLHLGVSPYVLELRRRQSVAVSRVAALCPYVLMFFCSSVFRVSGCQSTLRRQPITTLLHSAVELVISLFAFRLAHAFARGLLFATRLKGKRVVRVLFTLQYHIYKRFGGKIKTFIWSYRKYSLLLSVVIHTQP